MEADPNVQAHSSCYCAANYLAVILLSSSYLFLYVNYEPERGPVAINIKASSTFMSNRTEKFV